MLNLSFGQCTFFFFFFFLVFMCRDQFSILLEPEYAPEIFSTVSFKFNLFFSILISLFRSVLFYKILTMTYWKIKFIYLYSEYFKHLQVKFLLLFEVSKYFKFCFFYFQIEKVSEVTWNSFCLFIFILIFWKFGDSISRFNKITFFQISLSFIYMSFRPFFWIMSYRPKTSTWVNFCGGLTFPNLSLKNLLTWRCLHVVFVCTHVHYLL